MLTKLLTWATSCPYLLIFLGNLNLSFINWITNECTTEPIHTTLYNAVTNLGFEQLVTNNTRLNNCLDLIFCNNTNSVYGLQIKEPFSNSDHCMIDFCLNIHPHINRHNNSAPNYNFKKAIYDLINNNLSSLDWQNLFSTCIIADDHYRVFLLEINRIIKLYIPQITTKIKKSKLSISIKKLQSKKKSLWRRNKKGYVANFKKHYRNICNQIKTECTIYHTKQKKDLLCTNSNHAFYNFVNNKLKESRSIPPLKESNGKECNVNRFNLDCRKYDFCNKLGTHYLTLWSLLKIPKALTKNCLLLTSPHS
ncbi:uncharacterized protein LOC131189326 [Ahaetulla prasina]|uniref:uncharacterized protein LOC131189326 n=1 Tax=Ahaetulla prasina TaxID=499056 RepID=UPI002648A4FF|nr:uncharacterized protein LOC131189326 [Ahaetulla prasina]